MSYLVLARKWRPKNFTETAGQEHVLKALVNALDNERLHHAYLFTGTRGVGKTTIARILAKALNCETGITSKPCGECSACREIDEGRFVDLIEVDAATNTKVDDTRDLLDNVQYAPARGRFKVYLIDEVHMLSKSSFNALLKTLEEPPEHVKFLLATTDPQKLPITVLSRCLQFNLKRLTPDLIRDRLELICGEEKINYERAAMVMIARAADGSLRDALSLLDQAIAFCSNEVNEAPVAAMLGTIDRQYVRRILQYLGTADAAGLMAAVAEIDEQFPDYGRMLADLARALQRVAVYQVIGIVDADDDFDEAEISEIAGQISQEDVQLYYQTAIMGKRDLHLAPDPRSGAEMTLLRMLAFQPGQGASVTQSSPKRAAAAASSAAAILPSEPVEPKSSNKSVVGIETAQWGEIVADLEISGIAKELAKNCALVRRDGNNISLALDRRSEAMLTKSRQAALQSALSRFFARKISLDISLLDEEPDTSVETPQQEIIRQRGDRLDAAKLSLESDPNVQTLKDMFGAKLQPDSVEVIDLNEK